MLVSRRYLPSMPSLLALEAVDRLGSASAAAEELNLTQGAVSRQLQVLEGQLGVALFIRDKHRLRLTQGARDYCREVRRMLQGIGQATLTLRANPGGGALTLAIPPEQRHVPAMAAAVAAASGALVLFATRGDPRLSPDSITYLSVAEHLRRFYGPSPFAA